MQDALEQSGCFASLFCALCKNVHAQNVLAFSINVEDVIYMCDKCNFKGLYFCVSLFPAVDDGKKICQYCATLMGIFQYCVALMEICQHFVPLMEISQ